MATVRAHVGLDFLGGIEFGSQISLTAATPTKLAVSDGTTTITILGQGFAFNASGVTGGTVASIGIISSGQPIVDVTGLSLSLKAAADKLLASDFAGVLELALGSADQIFGSDQDDILASFGGNDVIDLGGGDDTFDGGSGVDTLLLAGSLSGYTFTTLATGEIEIVDLSGVEGTDVVSDVEIVRFGDGSEFDLAKLAEDGWHKSTADVELVASTYQFFTHRIPLEQGFEYLIDSAQNPNDLNDPYYEQFNRENRYINFASNLGTEGEGAAAFEAKFGALNFEQTVKTAYQEIMGTALTGAALQFFLDGQGFYEEVAQARVIRAGVDLEEATKIVAIGSILNEALKSGNGAYADAVEALVADLLPDGASSLLGQDLFAVA